MDTRVIVVSTVESDGERFFIMQPPRDMDLVAAMGRVPKFTSSAEAKAWARQRWEQYLHSLPALSEAGAREELAHCGFTLTDVEEKLAKARRAREWALQTSFDWLTEIGYRNDHGQTVTRKTDRFGSALFQRVYVLRCEECGHEHDVDGCEIPETRCPMCSKET
jgi:rubrerythrin